MLMDSATIISYSAENTNLWNIIIQLGIIAAAMLFCNLLRRRLPFIRNTLMPISVLAGFLLLILKCCGVLTLDAELMEILVYHCIALGFIAMSLRVSDGAKREKGDLGGVKSGAVIVSSYMIQAVVGLLITIPLALFLFPNLRVYAGLLLPMGYGQGPGQANNIGSTFEGLGFAGGRSFGLAIAAAGYLCACIVGVIVLNVLKKQGKVGERRGDVKANGQSIDFFRDENEIPVSDSIDKLSVQIAMCLVIYLLTFLVTWGITSALSAISAGLAASVNSLLWGFNFIIGSALAILTKVLLNLGKKHNLIKRQYQNNYLLNRISGFFFDLMIICGIASINPEDLSGLWVPFILLSVAGGVVTWFWLSWICKRAYKEYYYEGLISMYGMMTGTIGSGILLLREIDPEFRTPAANNLVLGSSYGILFGFPMMLLVGFAPKSDLNCYITLGICAVYFVLLALFICKVGQKRKKKSHRQEESR